MSSGEGNPIHGIVQAFKSLFKREDASLDIVYEHAVRSKLRSIFGSGAVAEAFTYFCRHGAATAKTLQSELTMPEATAYRTLKQLRDLGFVEPALKVSKIRYSKGGPRPTVWALDGASPDEVADALRLHYQLEEEK